MSEPTTATPTNGAHEGADAIEAILASGDDDGGDPGDAAEDFAKAAGIEIKDRSLFRAALRSLIDEAREDD